MRFYGKIEKGTFIINRNKDFLKYIKEQKDMKVEIEVKKVRSTRSLQQNALYWLWLEVIGKELGYDDYELHVTFRSMFLTDRSQKLPLIRSTTKLNKLQFGQYMDKIERKVSELGISLPQPEEY